MAPTLSVRLAALADLVVPGRPMADIGTDHAQLPSALVRAGTVPSAIGIDVHAGPLRAAADTVASGVELRLGDGLRPLRDGEVHTVVIAGMGGERIRSIVDAGVPAGVARLVLQPNTDWPGVRAWIASRRFDLVDEHVVAERDRFYLMLVVDPAAVASTIAWDAADLELGPVLRRRPTLAWRAWVDATRARLQTAWSTSADARPDDPIRRRLAARRAIFDAAAEGS